jgi:hypothetical protein
MKRSKINERLEHAIQTAEQGPALGLYAWPEAKKKANEEIRLWLDTWILPVLRDELKRRTRRSARHPETRAAQ